MLSSVRDVQLTLRAGRVDIPLQALKARLPAGPSRLRPPRFDAPTVSGELELRPMREIAVRELLSHARGGTARVHLPLAGATLKKGPFSIEIPDRAAAVIDFVVENGRILRDKDRTRGTIEPDISLPLGLKFRGIYLDDDGSIIADIAKFPNINLSWLNVARLRIPETLDALLKMLFRDPDEPEPQKRAETAGGDPDRKTLQVQMEGLIVEARGVLPRSEPLVLGELGAVELGPETRLDVDYSRDELSISGQFDVPRADLSGAGFSVAGLRATGRGIVTLQRTEGERRMAVGVRAQHAALDSAELELVDGSRVELRDVTMDDVDLQFVRTKHGAHWQFDAGKVRGRVAGGVLMVWIGGRRHPMTIAEMELEGGLRISDRGFEVDMEVSGAHLEIAKLQLPLGIADLEFDQAVASGSGRLQIGTEVGYQFTGQLAVSGELTGGAVDAAPIHVKLVRGTHVAINLEALSIREGLEKLRANGTIDFQLASGSIPVGPNSQMSFSRGASGTIAIAAFELGNDMSWPRLDAAARLTADTDPLVLPGVVKMPQGVATLEIPTIELDELGNLALIDATVAIADDATRGSASDGAP